MEKIKPIKSIVWNAEPWEDFSEMLANNEKQMVQIIKKLIDDIIKNGVERGIGKPKPLKYQLQGLWSREITKGDRLVYYVEGEKLFIVQCKTHYEKF